MRPPAGFSGFLALKTLDCAMIRCYDYTSSNRFQELVVAVMLARLRYEVAGDSARPSTYYESRRVLSVTYPKLYMVTKTPTIIPISSAFFQTRFKILSFLRIDLITVCANLDSEGKLPRQYCL